MQAFKPENGVPVKIWAEKGSIEQGAIDQIENTARLPFAFHHVALMPDGHQGYGAPIGGVLATKDVVVVNFVGVDIGCGMCAVKTSLKEISQEEIKKIFGGSKEHKGGIRSCVPVGFSHHSKAHPEWMPELPKEDLPIAMSQYDSACKQVGTLGGGNHFIEIQKGSDGYIWIMLHSGSRNLGYKVANHYNELAKYWNKKWYSSVPKEWDLAFLPIDSEDGSMYLAEMNYCLDFARANRAAMMNNILKCFAEQYYPRPINENLNETLIDIHHNYATMENHFGTNVMVHRKGATRAREGEIGIIPGSQGTKSYIVRGKGNSESFMSCSHGAGRKLGRKAASRELDLEKEINMMNEKGIIHSIRTEKDLDEAPGAYKDIDQVMNNQEDLVEIVVELSPLAVIKA